MLSKCKSRAILHAIVVRGAWLVLASIWSCSLSCRDRINPSTVTQVNEFYQLSPPGPAIDLDKVVGARIPIGPYRVTSGDVLEITLPSILCVETTERVLSPDGMTVLPCRVTERGTLSLPVVGELAVADMSLEDVERVIATAYHQAYSNQVPSVFARVQEYMTKRVSIMGAVASPGIYDLRNDQMSLVSLIMTAGGITADGASKIRIIQREQVASDVRSAASASTNASDAGGTAALRMSFLPHGAGHAQGRLSIYYGDSIVVSETLDLSEDNQRMAFLKQLDNKLPKVSLNTVESELARLPKVMESSKGISQRPVDPLTAVSRKHQTGFAEYRTSSTQVEQSAASHYQAVGRVGDRSYSQSERTIVLPVRGLNIPFADIALAAGDRVTVEPLVMPMFTVIGLVNNQGNFEYPPGETFSLIEAIGFAQGLDRVADPRYAVIYRLTSDGSIAHTYYDISKASHEESELPAAMSTIIRPGDIIDIAQTPRTRTKVFLANVFRITIGAYVPIWDGNY